MFTKFTGKYLCQSLKLIKRETLAQVFSCEFREILKNIFIYRTPQDDCFWRYENFFGFSLSEKTTDI